MVKKVLRQTVRDIGHLSVGSLALGAGAKAVSPFGAPFGDGLSSASSMLPTVGSLVMVKSQVGLLAEMNPYKQKRRTDRK